MAKSKLFDNIMQVIQVANAVNGTTGVSTEIDLELPRGYVAKIRKVRMEVDGAIEKWAAAELAEFSAALLLDPDDAVTLAIPQNTVEHDVLCEHGAAIISAAGTMFDFSNRVEWVYFEDIEDVITARNMRWNTHASTASFDDAQHKVSIYYTLEKIQDAQIMELLDIL